jgi:putative ABC transport system permease protein
MEQFPGVETVGRFRALRIDFRGKKVVAGFGNSELLWKYRPETGREEKERLQRLARYREVSVSDYLKVKYGLKKGDVVELRTPKGEVEFTVNNTSISYSTMSGFIYMDRRWLEEYWGLDDATSLSVYLTKGQDAGRFIWEIEKKLKGKYSLDMTDNSEFRRDVLRIFDKSFALTYTIELIAIIISLIGVVNALFILVFEKKREISVLRYLGATWLHIREVMVLSAGIIGITGIALGCLMGSAISVVITHVINKISFGWEVSARFPFLPLSILMLLLFITTTLAGLVPSYIARKIDPKAFISFE